MSESLETPNITFFNDNPFYITLIDDNDFDMNKLDWNHPNYVNNLISQLFIKTVQVTSTNFFDYIGKFFNATKNNILVTETIGEEPLHNYQIIYMDKINNNNKINQFATMLNTNGDVIQGKAVIIKNYVATLKNEIKFDDMDSNALHKMIKSRGFNTFVVWDDESEKWREQEMYGSIEIYAKKFFEDEPYKTSEIAFLKHNLNILYLKSEYGKSNVCGTLLNCKVEKVLIFTMLTSDFRGNITINEIEKIIKLSTVLTPPFKPETKWFDDEKDEHGRAIIKNKYRILDNVYQENFKV
jgi:hypothetical protein